MAEDLSEPQRQVLAMIRRGEPIQVRFAHSAGALARRGLISRRSRLQPWRLTGAGAKLMVGAPGE